MTQFISLFVCIYLTVLVSDSETSVKWNVMNKSIKIGDEAILNCNINACSPTMRKTWYGGRSYELLCYDDISTNPKKYEMKSYDTSFNSSLIIKHFNFTDINCEYTCACGFNRYTHMLKLDDLDFVYGDIKDSSKLKDNIFIVEVEMKVYPIPKCSIIYQLKEYSTSVNRVELGPSTGDISTLYSVTIKHSLEVDQSDSNLLINVTCQIGPSTYHVSAYNRDIDTSKEFGNVIILKIILITVVIAFLIVLIIGIMLIKRKCKKTRDAAKNKINDELSLQSMLPNDDAYKSMSQNSDNHRWMTENRDTYKPISQYRDTNESMPKPNNTCKMIFV